MCKFIYINEQIGEIPKYSIGIAEDYNDNYEVQFVYQNIKKTINKNEVSLFDPLKIGDGFSNKVCNVCHRYLNTIHFQKNQNGKGDRTIRRPSCNDCRKEMDGKNVSPKDRREWNKKEPKMIIWQCPICNKTTIPKLTSKVVLDHDHKTGAVRGWICDSCNTGIGRFKDEVALLESAIDFLKTN